MRVDARRPFCCPRFDLDVLPVRKVTAALMVTESGLNLPLCGEEEQAGWCRGRVKGRLKGARLNQWRVGGVPPW